MKYILQILTTIFSVTNASRILAIMPFPSYSHQVVFQPLWRALSLRGHQVTLITTDPLNDPTLTNLTEISVRFTYDMWDGKDNNLTGIINDSANIIEMYMKIIKVVSKIMDAELSYDQVQRIIKGPDDQFDVLIVEFLQPTMFAFQHRFNLPMIGVVSLEAHYMGHEAMGNPTHPILYPDFSMPMIPPLSFIERVKTVLFQFFNWYLVPITSALEDATVRKHFGHDYPPLNEIRGRVDLLLVNANPALQAVRPTVPGTIYIGGGIHLTKPKDLPQDIQTFLDEAAEGVVYFSLGSNVKSKDIPEKTRQTILDTFADLPYKVLWKFEAETLEGKPDNVKIMKWIPQQDVLRHKNIKVFITQGGLQSTEEALFNHVPLVVMPFFGDQEMNAKRIELKGFGLSVDHKNLDRIKFTETLLEVIKNRKYRDTARQLAELALDEPMTGLEKAIWWTEYVLRHKGAKHLKGPAVHLPLYQYFFLDIIAFVFAILATLIVIIALVVKYIKRLLFGNGKKKDEKKVKSS